MAARPLAAARCACSAPLVHDDVCTRCGRLPRERSACLTAEGWTPEKVVLAIQVWVRRHGRIPRQLEWKAAAHPYPSHFTAVRLFGTWKDAIRAAGYTPDRRGRKPNA